MMIHLPCSFDPALIFKVASGRAELDLDLTERIDNTPATQVERCH
jgi:hypothetical protein